MNDNSKTKSAHAKRAEILGAISLLGEKDSLLEGKQPSYQKKYANFVVFEREPPLTSQADWDLMVYHSTKFDANIPFILFCS